jgi:hypothetical protein
VCSATGDRKRALDELRKAVDKGFNNPEAFADKDFDRLRDDPAFKELLARVTEKAASEKAQTEKPQTDKAPSEKN